MANGLLSAMSLADQALLEPYFELVELSLRQSLFTAHKPIEYVHFFLDGLSSEILTVGRQNIEVGCVGREGLSGHSVLLDVDSSPHCAFMQSAGTALRIRSSDLLRVVHQSASLHNLLLRYVHVFMTQIAQSALADARFTLPQRLARWLLMCQDRAGEAMPVTHAYLALMLGVRRPSVTTAMHVLEGQHLIKAGRAYIRILDRAGLIAVAGDSYGMAEAEYRRLINKAP